MFAFSYSFKSVFDFSNKIATISAMVTKVHMGNVVSDIAKESSFSSDYHYMNRVIILFCTWNRGRFKNEKLI